MEYNHVRFDRYHAFRLRRVFSVYRPSASYTLNLVLQDALSDIAGYAHGCVGYSRWMPRPLPLPL